MAEVIDLCGSCDEDGAFPRESLAVELESDGDSDEELLDELEKDEYESEDDDAALFAEHEVETIDLSRSLHDVTPWTAQLPFDVEFEGNKGNVDIMRYTKKEYKGKKIYFPVRYCKASHRQNLIRYLNLAAHNEGFQLVYKCKYKSAKACQDDAESFVLTCNRYINYTGSLSTKSKAICAE